MELQFYLKNIPSKFQQRMNESKLIAKSHEKSQHAKKAEVNGALITVNYISNRNLFLKLNFCVKIDKGCEKSNYNRIFKIFRDSSYGYTEALKHVFVTKKGVK
jgi:hypothetical protein